jgi:hypothetical protein
MQKLLKQLEDFVVLGQEGYNLDVKKAIIWIMSAL